MNHLDTKPANAEKQQKTHPREVDEVMRMLKLGLIWLIFVFIFFVVVVTISLQR